MNVTIGTLLLHVVRRGLSPPEWGSLMGGFILSIDNPPLHELENLPLTLTGHASRPCHSSQLVSKERTNANALHVGKYGYVDHM